jgi:hypothetical protein
MEQGGEFHNEQVRLFAPANGGGGLPYAADMMPVVTRRIAAEFPFDKFRRLPNDFVLTNERNSTTSRR